MRTSLHSLTCCVLALSLAATGFAAETRTLGAETPDQLVANLKAATAAEDPIALAAMLTPQARTEMSAGITIGGLMMVAMQGFGLQMATGIGEAFGEGADEAAQAEAAKSTAELEAKIKASTDRLEGILTRHGLPDLMDESGPAGSPEEAMKVFENIDHLAYLTEMFAFFKETFPEESEASNTGTLPGDIGVPVISGTTGVLPVGEEKFDIVQIDGRWYLSPPSEAPAPVESGE